MMKPNYKNDLACTICGKPEGITLEECHGNFGRDNSLCCNAGKCRIAEKTEEQLKYILSSNSKNVFLKACPGSGKTESVGLKAAYEIKKWKARVGGISILTFTNSAADVISDRVTQFAGIAKPRYPHFIGTIDSWLHGYIAHPFSHILTKCRGKNGDCSISVVASISTSGFLNSFRTKYGLAKTGKAFANQYYKDIENSLFLFSSFSHRLDTARNSISLQQWQIEDLQQTKKLFWEKGFATYQDIENICYRLLCENADLTGLIAERFPFLIIDECQDLSWIQLQIFKKLIEAGSHIHFVGDLNQGYAFKKVYPRKVEEFVECHSFETLVLSKNLRSVQPIVNLCGKIIPNQGVIRGASTSTIDPCCVYYAYDKNKIQEVVGWFFAYLEKQGLRPSNSAVVARGYSTVNKLRPAASRIPHNRQLRLATAIHLWQNGGMDSMGEALNCIGRFVARDFFASESTNSRAYYCPECVPSPLHWRLFLAQVLDKCIVTESLRRLHQVWSEWAKAVREQFEEIVRSCSRIALPPQNSCSFSFRSLKGKPAQTVISTLETVEKSDVTNIRVTTFHQVKGQTFDAILVVSAADKRSDGGHWCQWIGAAKSDGEHARFAYVASSRPRVLLGWAVPSPSADEEEKLKALGFTKAKKEDLTSVRTDTAH
jgi:DNA helicase II / ATP-dependent DNA helicase PcrA